MSLFLRTSLPLSPSDRLLPGSARSVSGLATVQGRQVESDKEKKNLKTGFSLRRLFAIGVIWGSLCLLTAQAAAALTLTPSTWNVIGLDSNSPAFGPSRFPVGAKVCGGTPGSTDTAAFTWDTGGTDDGTYIDLRSGSANPVAITFGADGCADAYFEVEIAKNAAAFGKTRRYHISAGAVSTPIRELYVEKLISQSRNYITNVRLDGASIPAGGSMNLVVGNTYTIQLYGGTATQGYNQFEEFINFPNTIFQVLSVTTDYSANDSPYVSTSGHKSLYADACGWENDPNSPYYRSCMGGNYKSGGSNVVTTYTVRIVGGGGSSERLSTLLYDFSGASFHYNADYSTGWRVANIIDPASITIAKSFFPNPTNVGGVSALTFTITNPNAGAISGLNFTDVFPTSPGNMTLSDAVTSNSCGGALTDDSGGALNAGDGGIRLTGGTAPANGSCTIQVNVTTDATGGYDNTSGNLFVDTLDTGKTASASLTVNSTPPPPAPPSSCANPVTLATWNFDNLSTGVNSAPANSYQASDVSTATASYNGSGNSSIINTVRNSLPNAWGAAGWPREVDGQPSATTTPYYEFVLDTSRYGGVTVAFQARRDNQWTGIQNYVRVHDRANAGSFNTYEVSGLSGNSWLPVTRTAVATGSDTTTFRINAYYRHQTKPAAEMYLDDVVITGCPRPDPPTISKDFSPAPVAVDGTSTLTFVVANPNTAMGLSDIAFNDTLPSGLTVAPGSSSQCGGTLTLTAPDGISFAGGTLGVSGSCTITAPVTATTAGPHENVSGFISHIYASNTYSNTGSSGTAKASLTALAPPSIAKQFAPNPILSGSKSTLTFLIENPNQTQPLSGVAFSDAFPATMTVAAPATYSTTGCGTPTFAPAAGANSISFSNATITAGGTCTVTVEVTATATGTNTSSKVSHTLNGPWEGNTATDTLTISPPNPRISLLKQVSTTALGPWTSYVSLPAGSNVNYQFTVENAGDVDLAAVAVDDPAFGGAVPGCSWATLSKYDTVTCTAGPVSAAAGVQENTATASGVYGGTTYASEPSTARYATTGLTLDKSAAQANFTAEGNALNYIYAVTNSGAAVLIGPVTVSDDKTAVSCPALSTVGDNDNFFDPGESLTCTATYAVTAADVTAKQVTNTASATVGGVTSPTASVTVPLAPDLTAIKTNNVGGTAPTNTFVWTLTVANSPAAGTDAAFTDGQILLTDDLPDTGATYAVGAGAVTAAGTTGIIACTIATDTLNCAASGAVAIPPALQGSVSVTNGSETVTGTGTAFTSQLTAESVMLIEGVPYTVASIASDTELTLTAAYPGTDATGLAVPGSFSVPVIVTITGAGPLVNPRSGGACKADPGTVVVEFDETNNDCADTVAVGLPLFTILKSADKASVVPGETITYTVQIVNTGNGVGTNVVLTDRLSPYTAFGLDTFGPGVRFSLTEGDPPSGLTFDALDDPEYSSDNGENWTYVPNPGGGGDPPRYDGAITNWRLPMTGNMAVGGSFTLTYQVRVK